MEQKLTVEDARRSLNSHAEEKGLLLRAKYGPRISWKELCAILDDRSLVRYPCTILFDASGLLAGEFAHPFPNTDKPEDGFKICIHPVFMTQLEQVPLLVLYQMVLVNYGEFASPEDAETFAAAALGLDREDYYDRLCKLADQLGSPECA